MTREKSYLQELKPYSNSYVTFDDRVRGRIKGIWKIVSPRFPCLDDMLLVERLTSNLISISQLRDQGINVSINKSECIVSSKDQEVLMNSSRSRDNWYMWISQSLSCLISKVDKNGMGHHKLSQFNLKSMDDIMSKDVIKGISKLKGEKGEFCGDCQIGKMSPMQDASASYFLYIYGVNSYNSHEFHTIEMYGWWE